MTAIIIGGCVVILVMLLVGAIATRNRQSFNERFPPISDSEFLALCSPRTDPAIALKVRRIVAKHLAINYNRVYPTMRFIEDIGAD